MQTVQGVSARFDALIALFERFQSFLERLDIRVKAPLEPASRTVAVKTLVEMIRTLAYATQMMRHNRASEDLDKLISAPASLTFCRALLRYSHWTRRWYNGPYDPGGESHDRGNALEFG